VKGMEKIYRIFSAPAWRNLHDDLRIGLAVLAADLLRLLSIPHLGTGSAGGSPISLWLALTTPNMPRRPHEFAGRSNERPIMGRNAENCAPRFQTGLVIMSIPSRLNAAKVPYRFSPGH
jgi:hypothetical protein